MSVIRTPDERFSVLPDFTYQPHYIDVNGLRVHYVDEGKGRMLFQETLRWSCFHVCALCITPRASIRETSVYWGPASMTAIS